tara:strand:+ start:399 stop:1013 length:615 start_codon:yes stop_codon:yes gene_type:complete
MNIVEKDNVFDNKFINNNLLNKDDISENIFDEIKIENKENLIQKKKKLIELVKNLSKLEYTEIFNIFQEDNCSYTGNSNGVFINLTNVSEDTINKIFDFIDFIKKKKKELLDKENILENIKKDINEIEIKNDKIELNLDISNNNYEELSDNDEEVNIDNYLCFSSDEDDDLDNKLCLKKKKIKYSGKKAKLIKSIKDSNEKNRN